MSSFPRRRESCLIFRNFLKNNLLHKFNQDSRLRGNDGELTISCGVLGFAKVSGCLCRAWFGDVLLMGVVWLSTPILAFPRQWEKGQVAEWFSDAGLSSTMITIVLFAFSGCLDVGWMCGSLKPLQNLNGCLKSKMERRRLVAKWLHGFVGWQDVSKPPTLYRLWVCKGGSLKWGFNLRAVGLHGVGMAAQRHVHGYDFGMCGAA